MNEDFRDVLGLLLDAEARFLVVGAYALAAHGIPRATGDLDIWVEPTPENSARVWRAITAFGAPVESLKLAPEDLQRSGVVVQIGVPPRRIDLLTEITGVGFAEAWPGRTEHDVAGRSVPFLGRQALVKNKQAVGRLRDQADLEALGER